MLGEKVAAGIINKLQQKDPNSLDNMDLDRRDNNDAYDPFFKNSNKLDLELQGQMAIMNKASTLANKMWTPEYQQQIQQQQIQ
jgi:hypothetical protein